ncbi:MAG: ORF6N domain-containing protein, partial [Candidatus Omnitrophica bacterium]|nr:ORF6N domain-containing protein [Candidatus Omnitrophota bacterium]
MRRRRNTSGGRGVVLVEHVERRILLIRGHKVMLDADLAELYGVRTQSRLQNLPRPRWA